MIHVICGMMGAGKSTYARKRGYDHVLELEDFGRKDKQIRRARELNKRGEILAYITCYPTPAEMTFFNSLPDAEVRWLLIDTDYKRCEQNIRSRRRGTDADVIKTKFEKNKRILSQIAQSSIQFEKIKIFVSEERW